jgi:membrane-bound lytic murein transglycosylase F
MIKKTKLTYTVATVLVILIGLLWYVSFGLSDNSRFKLKFSKKEIVSDRSLEKIIEKGELVVLSENSTVSYFIYRGHKVGFEYEILKQFAKELGVKLEYRIVKDLDKIIPELNKGHGDIIACNYTVTRDRKKEINFSIPYLRSSQVLVQRKPKNWYAMSQNELATYLIKDPAELARKHVHVWGKSSYYKRLYNLMDEIGDTIYIHPESGEIESEELIRRVSEGIIDYTVIDKNVALINKRFYNNIDISVELSVRQKIAFGLRKQDKQLQHALNKWLDRFMKQRLYGVLKHKYFEISAHTAKAQDEYSSLGGGKISPYDDIIKQETKRLGWDWRLVASLIFQESQFNHEAESWQGSYGLMQFMPTTGEIYGVFPDSPPEDQIRGGVKYLKVLFNQFKEIPDSLQRMKFTIASYNAGLTHVQDAQEIAKQNNANHLVWDDEVEKYLLKLSLPEYYKLPKVKGGYYRGNMTYRYTREVFRRFDEYQTVFK